MVDHLTRAEVKRLLNKHSERVAELRRARALEMFYAEGVYEHISQKHFLDALLAYAAALRGRIKVLEDRARGESWVREFARDLEMDQVALGQFLMRALEAIDENQLALLRPWLARTESPKERRDYWDEDPLYPSSDWQYEVANGDTREGYWAWVESKQRDAALEESE